jgi:hypothetical protein
MNEVPITKFLGIQTDKLNWKNLEEYNLSKLSSAIFAITSLKTMCMMYFSFSHSIIKYGILFGR